MNNKPVKDMDNVKSILLNVLEKTKSTTNITDPELEGDESPSLSQYYITWPADIPVELMECTIIANLHCQYNKSLDAILHSCTVGEINLEPELILKALQKRFHKALQNCLTNDRETLTGSSKFCSEQNRQIHIGVDENSEPEISSSDASNEDIHQHYRVKKIALPPQAKELLEKVFEVKKCPNASERSFIAQKLNLTASQVRTWFTNKRMRTKSKAV